MRRRNIATANKVSPKTPILNFSVSESNYPSIRYSTVSCILPHHHLRLLSLGIPTKSVSSSTHSSVSLFTSRLNTVLPLASSQSNHHLLPLKLMCPSIYSPLNLLSSVRPPTFASSGFINLVFLSSCNFHRAPPLDFHCALSLPLLPRN